MHRPSWLADRSSDAGPLGLDRIRRARAGRTFQRVAVEPIRPVTTTDVLDALRDRSLIRERSLECVRAELGLD